MKKTVAKSFVSIFSMLFLLAVIVNGNVITEAVTSNANRQSGDGSMIEPEKP